MPKSLVFKPLRLEAAPNEVRDQIFSEFNEEMSASHGLALGDLDI